jgi:hypothetical protein
MDSVTNESTNDPIQAAAKTEEGKKGPEAGTNPGSPLTPPGTDAATNKAVDEDKGTLEKEKNKAETKEGEHGSKMTPEKKREQVDGLQSDLHAVVCLRRQILALFISCLCLLIGLAVTCAVFIFWLAPKDSNANVIVALCVLGATATASVVGSILLCHAFISNTKVFKISDENSCKEISLL